MLKTFYESLTNYKKILFLTCSNRGDFHAQPAGEMSTGEMAKSTYFAYHLEDALKKYYPEKEVNLIEVPHLKIYACEGNVSSVKSKGCGVKEALLKDSSKNPSGYHRCWASINNKDDELWVITKELFEADCVIFFGSIRWGQTNAIHQNLIERLTWIENRHTQLGEEKIKLPDAGVVLFGQNYNGMNALENQLKVFEFFGFNAPRGLSFNWQASSDEWNESAEAYAAAVIAFERMFDCHDYFSNRGSRVP